MCSSLLTGSCFGVPITRGEGVAPTCLWNPDVSVNWPRAQPAHCSATVKKYGAYRFPCVQELSHFRGRPDDRMSQNEQEYAVSHATLTNSETTVESIDSVIFAVHGFITHTKEGFIGMVSKTIIVLERV